LNLAQALERSGRATDAIVEYGRVLALAPNHRHAAARKSALEQLRTGRSP
jgi:hypothetical protein